MEKKIELYKTAEVSSDQILEIATRFAKDNNSIMIVPDEMHRVKVRIALGLSCDYISKSKLTDIFISGSEDYNDFTTNRKNLYVISTEPNLITKLVNYALLYKLNLYGFYGVKKITLTSLTTHSLESVTGLLNTTEVILGLPHSGKTEKLIDKFIEAYNKETYNFVIFYTCEVTAESIINRIKMKLGDSIEPEMLYKIQKITNLDRLKSILFRFYLSKKDCVLFLDSPSSIYQPTDKTLSTFLKEMKDDLELKTSNKLRIIYTETVNFKHLIS